MESPARTAGLRQSHRPAAMLLGLVHQRLALILHLDHQELRHVIGARIRALMRAADRLLVDLAGLEVRVGASTCIRMAAKINSRQARRHDEGMPRRLAGNV